MYTVRDRQHAERAGDKDESQQTGKAGWRTVKWTVILEAEDGGLSVHGPFPDEYAATLWANGQETEDSADTSHVRPLEAP